MKKDLLQRLTEITEANLSNEKFGVKELAHELGMSYSSLTRKVHALAGKSVLQVIKEIRLKKAFELINNEGLTVSETAYRVGFGSPSYFISCFHVVYGYPPGEIRKRGASSEIPVNGDPGPIKKISEPSKRRPQRNGRLLKRHLWTYGLIMVFLLFALTGFIIFKSVAHTAKSVNRALPVADSLYRQNKLLGSYLALQNVKKHLRETPKFQKLDTLTSSVTTILSDPPGVKVFYRIYHVDSLNWHYLGRTPLDSVKVPVAASADILMIKRGYDTVIGQHWFPERMIMRIPTNYFYRRLFPVGSAPPGMVHVVEKIRDTTFSFFIDKFEVTNRQYKEFMDNGGYRNPKYWKYPFIQSFDTLTWEQAMDQFRDEYYHPGPRSWKRGHYPAGQDGTYPVGGISWYEAAAYAEYAGKELPALRHRITAAWGCQYEIANYINKGPVPVGTLSRFNNYGALDMAGNLREWCFNSNNMGMKWIAGGAYDDGNYTAMEAIPLSPWDRSEQNGFRCVIYMNKDSLPQNDFHNQEFRYTIPIDYTKVKTPSEKEFQGLKHHYDYAREPVEPVCLARDTSHPDWIFEKVEFSTPSPGGRMIAQLWLPKNAAPPYQVFIHSPSIQPYEEGTSDNWAETITGFIGPFIRTGRAWMAPMYTGAWERRDLKPPGNAGPAAWSVWVKNIVTDLRRSIDYLESRPEVFNPDGICLYSQQWGAQFAVYAAAVDDRVDALIFDRGGMLGGPMGFPEVNTFNFIPFIKAPTFLFARLFDPWISFEMSMQPLHRLLRINDDQKEIYTYLGRVNEYPIELYSITQSFLDRNLGKVKK